MKFPSDLLADCIIWPIIRISWLFVSSYLHQWLCAIASWSMCINYCINLPFIVGNSPFFLGCLSNLLIYSVLVYFECRLPACRNDSIILSLLVGLQGIGVELFLLLAFLLVLSIYGKSLRRTKILTFLHIR